MKRKVSISSYLFQKKFGDKEALKIAKEIGADCVDFNLDVPENSVSVSGSLYQQSDEEIYNYYKSVKDYADEIGIEICQTHGRTPGYKNIPEEDEILMKNTRIDLLATKALGAPYCVIHNATSIYLGPDAERSLMHKLSFDMFTKALTYAKEYDVKIATETFGDAVRFKACDFFGNINEFLIAYNKIKNHKDLGKYFCICVDTGHSNKASLYGNPSPADVIRMCGNDVLCLHLNDNDKLTDQHKTPFTGTIDWNDVFDALDEIGYNGVYNMELDLRHFGEDFFVEEAAFAIKVLRHTLNKRYPEE